MVLALPMVHPGAIRTDMIKATLEDSDDIEAARKNYEMVKKMGVDPEIAANKIINAIEKNKKKARIGKDSFVLDYVSRYTPWLANFVMRKIAEKQAKTASR